MIRFDDDQSTLLCRDADTKTAPLQHGRRRRRRDLFAARHRYEEAEFTRRPEAEQVGVPILEAALAKSRKTL
jgi:hypothetical protein